MNLNERLDAANASGFSLARIARHADVRAMRLYNAACTPDELKRVEQVLDRIARGELAPRRPTVPA